MDAVDEQLRNKRKLCKVVEELQRWGRKSWIKIIFLQFFKDFKANDFSPLREKTHFKR